jgi:hypothetical protein
MASTSRAERIALSKRYKDCHINCQPLFSSIIDSLSEFFAVFHSLLDPTKTFWFRGHSDIRYSLTPSALRYNNVEQIERAIGLVTEMRRFLEMKLPRPPASDDLLGWMQVGQHYELPTRLLDWTQNAAVALFFACYKKTDIDGLVVVISPIELNQAVDPSLPRIFNMQNDANIITPYLNLNGKSNPRGKRTIAINPTWNTERIALQQGAFTLHGSRYFELDKQQASSLRYIPILKEHKKSLLNELERVGVSEMFVFPEPEHLCSYLKHSAGL